MKLDHPQMGTTIYNGPPYRFSSYDAHPTRHAPLLGEHTAQILTGLLGLSAGEVDALKAEGVLQ